MKIATVKGILGKNYGKSIMYEGRFLALYTSYKPLNCALASIPGNSQHEADNVQKQVKNIQI